MLILKSLLSAFLMYSKIPVPSVLWREENRRYSLCFFPLVGVVIGGALLLWERLCNVLEINAFLFASVCTAVPVIITGGIHMDGFCDVIDAQSSHSPREKKLEILSDPHVGAFAVIYSAVYFLLTAGLFTEIKKSSVMLVVSLGFVLSRVLSGLAAVSFKSAKESGALQSFVSPAHKIATIITLIIQLLLVCFAMIIIDPVSGDAVILASGLTMLYYRFFSYKSFGGITGDLAGFFLQLCELFILISAVISSIIREAVL